MFHKSLQYWFRLILLVLAVALLATLAPIILPFLVSFVLAVILLPLVNHLQDFMRKRLGWTWFPRSLAILPAFVLVGFILVIVFNLVFNPFITEFSRLINNLPYLLSQFWLLVQSTQLLEQYQILPPQVDTIMSMAISRISNYGVELAQQGISAVFAFAGALIELLLVPIITFYLLKDGRRLKNKVISIFPEPQASHISDIVNKIHSTLGGYLRGQLVLATNMFVIVFIVATIFELPYPFVLALLGAVAEWLPIIGPFISALPAIILASLIGGSLAIKVAIVYFVILLIDAQIIMPKLMGRVIKLHPLVIISVIFIGGTFYGMLGMMVAVPITAVLQIILDRLWYFNTYYKKGE